MAYVLIYFLRGGLPWQGYRILGKDERYKKICEAKSNISPEELCSGLPRITNINLAEFSSYLDYTKNLGYEDEPDYDHLRGLFKNVMDRYNYVYDNDYDWDKQLVKTKFSNKV